MAAQDEHGWTSLSGIFKWSCRSSPAPHRARR
jgi:hypothetical protein